jgi:alkylhydroperoxidase family enzyme
MALSDQSGSDPTMVTAADYETQFARPHFAALEAELKRLREALDVALDALRRSADDHGCDYCRADVASVERALGLDGVASDDQEVEQ